MIQKYRHAPHARTIEHEGHNMKIDFTNIIFWIIYLLLLGVLLPHTAWAFGVFEPNTFYGELVAWTAAIVFESGLAVLTHKLSRRIESSGKRRGLHRWAYCYLSPYAFGLYISISVSVLANLSHSVEFGRDMAIFSRWGIPSGLYSVAFGGVLPLASLLFAWVLSNDTEVDESDPKLDAAQEIINKLRSQVAAFEKQLAESKKHIDAANARALAAEAKAKEAAGVFVDDKRERIKAIRARWPELPQASVAIISGSSAAYVSEVVRGNGHAV